MMNATRLPKFLAVDFYCGAGGTTRGLLDAGGYVIAGIDKSPGCRDTYRKNNPNLTLDRATPAYVAKDIFPSTTEYPTGQQDQIWDCLNTLIPRYRKMSAGLPLLFAICAPCQSFNRFVQTNMTAERTAVRERDLNLLSQALSFVEAFKPDMVLSENIGGIERGKHGQVWKNFREDLRGIGYRIGSKEVCASKFGIAQRRRRSIIFGVKSDSPERSYLALSVPDQYGSGRDVATRDVIGDLDPLQPGQKHPTIANHACRNLSAINRRRLLAVGPGEMNFGFPEELQLPCHRRMVEKDSGKRGFGDVYTRIHPDQPMGTLTTRFNSVSNGRFGHYDPEQARGLSYREGALLQSFGMRYEFHAEGGDAVAQMVGNAVPPKLAEHLSTDLLRQWREESAMRLAGF